MKPETFTTHSLPVPDQFDAWRDSLHSVFDVLPREPLDSGFPAKGRYGKSGEIRRAWAPGRSAPSLGSTSRPRRDGRDAESRGAIHRGLPGTRTGV